MNSEQGEQTEFNARSDAITAGGHFAIIAHKIGVIFPAESDDDGDANGVFVDNLAIPSGGITAIVGGSGSGKSSLLGLLTGLRENDVTAAAEDTPSQLVLNVDGGALDLLAGDRPQPGDLGFVFQDSQLIKRLAARRNARLATVMADPVDGAKRANDLMHRLGLSGNEAKLAERLSGGQAQRIAVVRALAINPRILVCDEPTSSLDETTGRIVLETLSDWARETGSTVLWVTHNLTQAATHADRFLFLDHGRVLSDNGQPFVLPGTSVAERERAINDKLLDAERLPGLTLDMADPAPGMIAPPMIAATTSRRQRTRKRAGVFGVLWYLAGCAAGDVFVGFNRRLADNDGAFRRIAAFLGAPIWRSLCAVLLLGFLVFYGVALSKQAIGLHFAASLKSPEVSHFVLHTEGGNHDLLALKNLNTLGDRIAETERAGPAPEVFGRREHLLTEVWLPVEGGCDRDTLASGKVTTAGLRVFQGPEPLFADMMVSPTGAEAARYSDLPRAETARAVIVTPTLLARLGVESPEFPLSDICMQQFGPEKVAVAGLIGDIPGGGTYRFDFAMQDRAYVDQFSRNPPASARNDQGRLSLPPYSSAAIYFDYRNAEGLSCLFRTCDTGPAPAFSGFKINTDVMKQISGLLRTAQGADVALNVLGLAFMVSIAISAALAVQTFVEQNEKSICIMRAFGYRFGHILFLLLCQIAILALFAAVIFGGALLAFELVGVGWVAAAFDIPTAWLTADGRTLLAAAEMLLGVATFVTALVLSVWWLKNRYLGGALQAL